MKKAFALLLALVMVFALCACGASKTVVGNWEAQVDVAKAMGDELGEFAQYMTEAKIAVRLNMKEDNTFEMVLDGSTMLPAMRDAIKAYLEDYCTQSGMSLDDLASMTGMTVDQIIDMVIDEVDTSELTNSSTGTYSVDKNTVTLNFDEGTSRNGTWEGDSLTLPVEELGEITFTRSK